MVVGCLVLSLAAAGCGSQVSPETVAAAQGAGSPVVGGAAVAGSDSAVTGEDAGPGSVAGSSGGVDSGGAATSGGGGASGGGGDAAGGPAEARPPGAGGTGSCEGFENQVGITDSTITVGNVADISGPVPGLFQEAQDAAKAFATYFNATSDICGRKLDLKLYDARADALGDQQAALKACEETFAVIGSMSSADGGGAAATEECGLPDIRSANTTPERAACSTCFAAHATDPTKVTSAMPSFWLDREPEAAQSAAMLYVDVPAASANAKYYVQAYEEGGMDVKVVQAIPQSEINYAPYVRRLQDEGVEWVQYFGPYQFTLRLRNAMQQQGYEPTVFVQDSLIYNSDYIEQGGEAVDGSYVFTDTVPLDSDQAEVALYRSYLDRVAPGAEPTVFGLFAWSAARLFTEEVLALGGRLTRESLVSSLRGVEDWTGRGAHAPQPVGSKSTSECMSFLQLREGAYEKVSPGSFLCDSLIDVG